MIHFKPKSGFTLIEVLCALAIFMLVMVPLLDLSGMLALQAARHAHTLQRIMIAESLMFENRILQRYGKSPVATKKSTDPAFQLTYQVKEVGGNLASYKNVEHEQITIEWKEKGRKRTERIVSFVPRKEKSA